MKAGMESLDRNGQGQWAGALDQSVIDAPGYEDLVLYWNGQLVIELKLPIGLLQRLDHSILQIIVPLEQMIWHGVVEVADPGVAVQPLLSVRQTLVLDLIQHFLDQLLAAATVLTFTVRLSQGSIGSGVCRSG